MKVVKKLIITLLLLLGGCSIVLKGCLTNPPDSVFIKKFHDNKPKLELLKNMIIEDKDLFYIGRYPAEARGISELRKSQYLALLDELKIHHLGKEIDEETKGIIVSFGLSRRGGSLGGSMKRYYWYSAPPSKMDFILYGYLETHLTHIEDNWYLALQSHS